MISYLFEMNIAIISWQGTLNVLMEYSNIICVLNVQIAEFSGISIFLTYDILLVWNEHCNN